MARHYTIPTLKALFGQASHCAYDSGSCPTPLIFEDAKRGVRVVSAEIAHIRSGTPKGPRYVPGYHGVNEADNLLLLCPVHHKPVDEKASVYTIEELEEWKRAQVASGGAGVELTETELDEVAEKMERLIELLEASTTLDIRCRAVVGAETVAGLHTFPIGATGIRIGATRLDRDDWTYIGVEAQNAGSLACGIEQMALEFDIGTEPYFPVWFMSRAPNEPATLVLGPHAKATRLDAVARLPGAQQAFFAERKGAVIGRFRAFVRTGGDLRVESDWYSALLLPGLFKPGTTQDTLDALIAERDRCSGWLKP